MSSLHYSQMSFLYVLLTCFASLLVSAELHTVNVQPHFSHSNLIRTVDLSSGANIRETISVAAENKHSETLTDYYAAVPLERADNVAYYTVTDKASGNLLKMYRDGVDTERGLQFYKITLDPPLPPNGKRTMTMRFVHSRLLEPYPNEVAQLGKQNLLYTGNVYYVTPYATEKQKTVVRVPSNKILSYHVGPAPVERKSASLTYGPYGNMEPFTLEPMRIHFESTQGTIVVRNLLREFEISHWGGNAAVEEHYSLYHAGAKLKDPFNRALYQLNGHILPETSIVRSLSMYLPETVADPYFRDEIGNVSTSNFRLEPFNKRSHLEIRPRYPLYGGWNYTYYMGYNMPIGNIVKVMGTEPKKGQYVLRASFVQALDKMDAAYENVEVKVVLPEGATNIAHSVPFPLVDSRQSLTKTYLDTIGRPTVHLLASNVVAENGAMEFEISYDLPASHVLRKPIAAAVAFMAVFAVGKLCSLVEPRIVTK